MLRACCRPEHSGQPGGRSLHSGSSTGARGGAEGSHRQRTMERPYRDGRRASRPRVPVRDPTGPKPRAHYATVRDLPRSARGFSTTFALQEARLEFAFGHGSASGGARCDGVRTPQDVGLGRRAQCCRSGGPRAAGRPWPSPASEDLQAGRRPPSIDGTPRRRSSGRAGDDAFSAQRAVGQSGRSLRWLFSGERPAGLLRPPGLIGPPSRAGHLCASCGMEIRIAALTAAAVFSRP